MMVHLANGLVDQDICVDLVIAGGHVPYPELIDQRIQLIHFQVKHVYSAFFSLLVYITQNHPDAVLATRHRSINIAVLAHYLAKGRRNRKLAIRLSGDISSSIAKKGFLEKWAHHWQIRQLYTRADTVISVSHGVAEDFLGLTNTPKDKICVAPNPTIPDNIYDLSQKTIAHPWFQDKTCPIIIGLGRFTKRKDFVTLIKAFALVRLGRSCRLVLVGDGQERDAYVSLGQELGIYDDIYLPGYTNNPYAYMAKADVLALTSKAAEGSPNVLKEAMALGLPVVSTDCPSGPREILHNGQLGQLVPMQDPQSLAAAIEKTLQHPHDPDQLKKAVQPYTIQTSTQKYLQAMGLR
jgi:glycosyltransferase involved in cell wall biosynthesis